MLLVILAAVFDDVAGGGGLYDGRGFEVEVEANGR